MASKKEQERQRKRREKQVRLDLTTKEKLKSLADELGVPMSQLVDLFILYGEGGLETGDINLSELLEPSRSPLFRFNINLNKFKRKR